MANSHTRERSLAYAKSWARTSFDCFQLVGCSAVAFDLWFLLAFSVSHAIVSNDWFIYFYCIKSHYADHSPHQEHCRLEEFDNQNVAAAFTLFQSIRATPTVMELHFYCPFNALLAVNKLMLLCIEFRSNKRSILSLHCNWFGMHFSCALLNSLRLMHR